MKFNCPVTGLFWASTARSNLNLTLRVAHPALALTLQEVHQAATSWQELTAEDKHLLWSATLCSTPLLHSVRGKALRPTIGTIESTFSELLSLVTWASTRSDPLAILPQFVPETPSCLNTQGWLDACRVARLEWKTSRDAWALRAKEQDEQLAMDRALSKFQAANSISPEKLPSRLANWLLVASEVPATSHDLWRSILCAGKEQLLTHKLLSSADIDECLEHFESWEHPTLLRLFAIRQVKAKAIYLAKNSLDGEANLDFLLDPPKQGATFQLVTTEEKAVTISLKVADMAAMAQARLAAIRAAKAQEGATK